MQNDIDDDARHPASQNIDGVVSLDINCGETHQYEQRQHAIEQLPVGCTPSQNHEDGGHTDMTTGESRCRTFTCFMGILNHVVEEAVAITWHGERLSVGGKIGADIGEYAVGDVVETCSEIIILRSCYGQEDKDDVINEERR